MVDELEPKPESIRLSKILVGLSFFLPYLVDWLNTTDITHISIYAPIWVFILSPGYFFVGPTPMALLLFFYWIPYVLVGYQAHRFATGSCSTSRRYVAGVAISTIVAVAFTFPMMMAPRAQVGEDPLYSLVIPFPLVSILAVLFIPVLRPRHLQTPWTGLKSDDDSAVSRTDAEIVSED
ncbi:hypothetical protein EU546_00305 [Candidatus Thorarchaeota archaeon]|nr:MAG: hypothetical protein EU546_00305 [Candidatus Thorarchaeota archaeon]